MKDFKLHTTVIAVVSVFLFAGCYTQLETVHTERQVTRVYAPAPEAEKGEMKEQARERRLAQLSAEEEEEYLYGYEDGVGDGYEDGWADAEAYYFVDYDTRVWYDSYTGRHITTRPHVTRIYNYYGYPYTWHRPYYGRSFVRLNVRFGRGYYYNPYYGWYDPFWHDPFYAGYYGWHRYPAYGGFYGYPYFGNSFVFLNYGHLRVQPRREYAARTTGLRSSGLSGRNQRIRGSEARSIQSSRTRSVESRRSAIRNEVRSTNRTGTVNRTRPSRAVDRSGTTRSVDRNRNSGNVNRGSVNRQRSQENTDRSRGNINRQRSSGTASPTRGDVNRQRSSGTASPTRGDVNRQRSSENVTRPVPAASPAATPVRTTRQQHNRPSMQHRSPDRSLQRGSAGSRTAPAFRGGSGNSTRPAVNRSINRSASSGSSVRPVRSAPARSSATRSTNRNRGN